MKATTSQANALQEFRAIVLSNQATIQSLEVDQRAPVEGFALPAVVRESAMHVLSSPADVRRAAELSGSDAIVNDLFRAGQQVWRDKIPNTTT